MRGLRWVGEAALFSGAADGTVAYIDLQRGARADGERHAGAVCSLALQQAGGAGGGAGGGGVAGGAHLAASAGEDGQVKLWDLVADAAPACSRTLSGHAASVRGVAMEGELLVSGSDDCSIRVWSLASGQCVENVTAKGRPVLAVALKGHLLSSAGRDGIITVWDLHPKPGGAQLQVVMQLAGARERIYALTMTTSRIISAGSACAPRLWEHPLQTSPQAPSP